MLRIFCIMLALTLARSFYIYITADNAQCFYNSIFADEQLLVEVETPIISVAHRIVLKVTANSQLILEKDIINVAKITVPKASVSIGDTTNIQHIEYETCFKVEEDKAEEEEGEDAQPLTVPIPKGYLLSVKLMSNFSHKLESNLETVEQTNINYHQIESISERLMQLNSEQINLHQISEMKQKLTQTYLQALKEKVIIYSIMEIFMILLFTVIQVRLLRGYVNDISII